MNSWTGGPNLNTTGPYAEPYEYSVGNPEAPHQFQVLLKFDISSLSTATVGSASLNLTLAFNSQSVTGGPDTIGVKAFASDFSAAAFTAADYNTATLSLGSFTVAGNAVAGTPYSLDITSALQSAIDSGFDYFALQLNNVTADAFTTAPYGPEIVGFSSATPPTIEFTAVPEPSTVALLALTGVGILVSTRVRARRLNA